MVALAVAESVTDQHYSEAMKTVLLAELSLVVNLD